MKKQFVKNNTTNELKMEIKKTFDLMLKEVVKGKVSINDFTQQLSYNYTQKKMELSGSIF
jgi:hypothetical protein